MPHCELTREHTHGCIVLPNRLALLEALPRNAVVAEIGVAKGDFSQSILELAKPSRLHLVDAWQATRYRSDQDEVQKRFAREMASGQVVVNRGISTEVLPTFEDHYFDWVYIDTNHSYETTAEELRICRKKVKPDGHIAGHDFCTGNVVAPLVYGVIEACFEFCLKDDWKFEYLAFAADGHFSFCLKSLHPAAA